MSIYIFNPLHDPHRRHRRPADKSPNTGGINEGQPTHRKKFINTFSENMREISRRAALLPLLAVALQPLRPQPVLAAEVVQPVLQQPDKGFLTGSGLRYFDFREGEGPTPKFGQFIQFHYVAYTADESKGGLKQFDSTYSRGEPYFTKHGNGFTAQGIEEALHTMRPGAMRRVILPPAISYTANKGPVPVSLEGRETLYTAVGSQEAVIFDLQLVSVRRALSQLRRIQ